MAIDIESYLGEIDSENVCGEDLEYDADFIALEQEVQGKEEQTMGDSVIEAEPPNWREVVKQSEQILTRTRDLRVVVNYLRALTETQGVIGLADGINLLRSIIEKRWDSVHPQLDPDDDNDPTERINILLTLCDFESFLSPLQKIPLVESKALGRFSLRDIQIADGSITVTSSDEEAELPQIATIDGAFQECEAESLQTNAAAIAASLNDLNQLESFVTEQVGVNDAASFSELRTVLKEINSILVDHAERRGLNQENNDTDDSKNTEEEGGSGDGTATKSVKTAPPGINNNQDVIKALNLICEYYKKAEPSSPIPLLLERVMRLVGKDFMEVLQDMAPNGVEQVEFLSGRSQNQE